MNEYVMHQRLDGTDRQITVYANDESDLTSGNSPQEASGWRLVKDEAQSADTAPAEPVSTKKNTKE